VTHRPPISEVIEDFAREIIEDASDPETPLSAKLDAFSKVTAYFVGIHKVGAQAQAPASKTFAAAKAELEDIK
jgi:hypothetical protein